MSCRNDSRYVDSFSSFSRISQVTIQKFQFVTSHGRHSEQYGDPQSNWTDWQQAEEGECLVGIAASFGYPCGSYPSASEGEDACPRSYLGSTSINALVMKLPLVKQNEGNF